MFLTFKIFLKIVYLDNDTTTYLVYRYWIKIGDFVRQIHYQLKEKPMLRLTFVTFNKLQYYGIQDSPLKFCESHFLNRRKIVLVSGKWLEEVMAKWDHSQGSVQNIKILEWPILYPFAEYYMHRTSISYLFSDSFSNIILYYQTS